MEDTMRFIIIVISINLLLGGIQYAMSAGTYGEDQYGQETLTVAENIRDSIKLQGASDYTNPSEYQSQEGIGDEQVSGKVVIWDTLNYGLNPFPIIRGGLNDSVEESLYWGLSIIRSLMLIMCAVLLFQIIWGKKNS